MYSGKNESETKLIIKKQMTCKGYTITGGEQGTLQGWIQEIKKEVAEKIVS